MGCSRVCIFLLLIMAALVISLLSIVESKVAIIATCDETIETTIECSVGDTFNDDGLFILCTGGKRVAIKVNMWLPELLTIAGNFFTVIFLVLSLFLAIMGGQCVVCIYIVFVAVLTTLYSVTLYSETSLYELEAPANVRVRVKHCLMTLLVFSFKITSLVGLMSLTLLLKLLR